MTRSSPNWAEHPLLARIAGHAAAAPDTAAVIADGREWSYARLRSEAEARAEALRAAGLVPGDRVALTGERTPEQFANVLGVLIAGGLYVPLGERAPGARRAQVLDDSEARFLLDAGGALTVRHDRAAAEPLPPGYLLYTSGSTGRPKGVRITLDNLHAYAGHVLDAYQLAPGARAGQLADLGFDASAHEIVTTFAAGACLCVVPTRHVLMWPRYLRDLRVEAALLVPSQVRLAHAAGMLKPGSLPALTRVFLGAELVTGQVVGLIRAAAPDVAAVNLWGPTEGTVALTHHAITDTPADGEGAPIGRSWHGGEVILADEADGVGELWATGPQISPGYWRLPAADAERFVEQDGRRWYRTGDLARRDPAGFRFVGRRDRQVKVKGHRIELEEVERAVRRLAGTESAHVLADGDALVCVVAAPVDPDTLTERLRAEFPAYMVPARFVTVDALPIAASGKVDLARLREFI